MEPNEYVKDALAVLRREFPDAKFYEARLEFRARERSGISGASLSQWAEATWRIQVRNDSATADTLVAAVAELRAKIAEKALVPGRAERIAAILREVPDEGFGRNDVLDAARVMLERERCGR